jgi:nicotinamidase/pyrazinamidase
MARALIIVDVQNDFTEGGPFGPFGCDGNDGVARQIGRYTSECRLDYDLVVTTQDWHIEPGEHFTKHPIHCVAGTPGAELDPELGAGARAPFHTLVDLSLRKGHYDDDYSAFKAVDADGTGLSALLRAAGVGDLDVCGFAEEGCVAATVRDALAEGYGVHLLTDLTAASSPDGRARVEAELSAAGAVVSVAGGSVAGGSVAGNRPKARVARRILPPSDPFRWS